MYTGTALIRKIRSMANYRSGGASPLRTMKFRALAFFAVVGPGFITANVDNDAGGILTYSQAGAKFGYALLWTMIPINSRIGRRTGDGSPDGRRHRQGPFATSFGRSSGSGPRSSRCWCWSSPTSETSSPNSPESQRHSGSSASRNTWSCPLGAFLVWLIVVHGTYTVVERILLALSLFYFAYSVAALLSHPDWQAAALRRYVRARASASGTRISVHDHRPGGHDHHAVDAVLSAGVDRRKRHHPAPVRPRPWDVILGCIMTDVVALFIIVACAATLYVHGTRDITDAADAAVALVPAGGAIRLGAVCRGTVQRVAASAAHSAHCDGL